MILESEDFFWSCLIREDNKIIYKLENNSPELNISYDYFIFLYKIKKKNHPQSISDVDTYVAYLRKRIKNKKYSTIFKTKFELSLFDSIIYNTKINDFNKKILSDFRKSKIVKLLKD